ncbi:MAG: sensor histidine kinase [Bacteroidales bacterium]|nr:sensor histidine kinase [Bacteroidales bacterium]
MKRSVYLTMHALVWIVAIGITVLLGYDGYSGFYIFKSVYQGLNALLAAAWMLAIFYLFYSIVFPKYFNAKKLAYFLLSSLIIVGVLPLLFWLTFGLLRFFFNRGNAFDYFDIESYLGGIVAIVFIGVLGSAYRMIIDWFTITKEKSELENQNLQSQLQLLKYKINPHFLFNTLNNIDALIKEDTDKASLSLNKLSDMMRYMIYDAERNTVSLSDEIKYIENYIHLQKIRNSYPENIHFEIKGNHENTQIAPMLFLPFIENAFKHSALNNKNNQVDIKLIIEPENIQFTCTNTLFEKSFEKDATRGVGLDIIRKRLDLIYPNTYKLEIDQTKEKYIVQLTIEM